MDNLDQVDRLHEIFKKAYAEERERHQEEVRSLLAVIGRLCGGHQETYKALDGMRCSKCGVLVGPREER